MYLEIFINIFLGLIIALIIFLLTHTFYIYKGPNSKDIINKTYKLNNKCYKLIPQVYICPIELN